MHATPPKYHIGRGPGCSQGPVRPRTGNNQGYNSQAPHTLDSQAAVLSVLRSRVEEALERLEKGGIIELIDFLK